MLGSETGQKAESQEIGYESFYLCEGGEKSTVPTLQDHHSSIISSDLLVVRRSKIWLIMNFFRTKVYFQRDIQFSNLEQLEEQYLIWGLSRATALRTISRNSLKKNTDFPILGMSLYIHRPIGDSSHLLPHALHDFNLVTILSRQILFQRHCKPSESSSKEADFSFSDSMNYE